MNNISEFLRFFTSEEQNRYKADGGIILSFKDPPPPSEVINYIYYSSSTDSMRVLNLANQTCNCAAFREKRQYFPINDARRFCKCLISVAYERGYCLKVAPSDEFIDAYVQDTQSFRTPHAHYIYRVLIDGNPVIISGQSGYPWLNIFTRTKKRDDEIVRTGKIDKYGFAGRWASKYSPHGSPKIKEIINHLPRYLVNHEEYFASPEKDVSVFSCENLENMLKSKWIAAQSVIENVRLQIITSKAIKDVNNYLRLAKTYSLLPADELNALQGEFNKCISPIVAPPQGPTVVFFDGHIRKVVSLSTDTPSKARENLAEMSILEARGEAEQTRKNAQIADVQCAFVDLVGTQRIAKEKTVFYALPASLQKREVLALINKPPPDWYDRTLGHTHLGYKYSNYADDLAKKTLRKIPPEPLATILDYISSLGIQDGSMSKTTLARLFYYKAYLAHRRNETDLAIPYLRKSLELSRNKPANDLLKAITR